MVHYCGHRISTDGPFPPEAEYDVAARVESEVAGLAPGSGYGALASGADILWAEALLRHGAELHVVLPIARAGFVETLCRPVGR